MTFSTLDAYKDAISSAVVLPITVGSLATVAGRTYDTWTTAPPVGTAPTTTPSNPTSATAGALGPFQNAGSGLDWRVVSARFSSLSPGCYIVCDRHGHMGGLSATTAGSAQTVAVAASSRNSTGVGCWIALTIYTQIGTTATTVSAVYDDSSATSSTTPTVAFGGTGFREAGRTILLPFDPASTAGGVSYVTNVTVTATTGTAGNFGLSIIQPLFAILVADTSGVASAAGFISGSSCGGIPAIADDACLFVMPISTSTNCIGAGALLISETAE